MSIAYLNGEFLPLDQARISPLDRGFLFGDGIYEVIPSYGGKLVGFGPHIDRMQEGLGLIEIGLNWSHEQWRTLCEQLCEKNGNGNLGVYLHVSRGADTKRFHAYPEGVTPTVFAFTFEIPAAPVADKSKARAYKVSTTEDLRWRRCNIKSTALLGNVMHFQQGHAAGNNETILYNARKEVTEASACNVFIVKGGEVITPPLDNQLLPGITRLILIDVLKKYTKIPVVERTITLDELYNADEVWITSSSKEIAPVTLVDGKTIGTGDIGDTWLAAETAFAEHRYDY
ncbi:D-amino acid aminotransferase [Simiduia sp. 21SJ11W-1]|uniref:D-amino acid aminotransferase n=1 Tax=Simiduia sp. 21SJ11W-1 TaxID=2909669 RepID=UPI0020A164DC|nr:D-amino acid aminotransferase [Simiduia sp. 21SJ11W-1]UTA47836.1 D-amino acid aminotransferase [Simiduia sp. 21SJ11W-1]